MMTMHLNWPPAWWQQHKNLKTERAAAEERAAAVHRTVVEPLRAMRAYDYLTGAVAFEIRRQVRKPEPEPGDDSSKEQGGGPQP